MRSSRRSYQRTRVRLAALLRSVSSLPGSAITTRPDRTRAAASLRPAAWRKSTPEMSAFTCPESRSAISSRCLTLQTRTEIVTSDLYRKVPALPPRVCGDLDADNNFKADAQRCVGRAELLVIYIAPLALAQRKTDSHARSVYLCPIQDASKSSALSYLGYSGLNERLPGRPFAQRRQRTLSCSMM
jgi:hypothetical protein